MAISFDRNKIYLEYPTLAAVKVLDNKEGAILCTLRGLVRLLGNKEARYGKKAMTSPPFL
ncbi:hypothetical protein VY86_16540 [Photorhabdus thracensis]|uniref:Uncharacterized protein n=1 Tax=Photorhabdus thracensis TaxID=230089 RepID=A0A0F7LS45_9GAMM|nr:hypothetical protein VY86_16540 [Photorhabdus thracensis]